MALATLSIDVVAQLGRLEEGMARSERIVKGAADQMQRRFDGLNTAALSLARTLAVGFVTVGLTRFTTEALRGLDALNDFKDATGASIENASALEDIAARTGTAFEAVETSVVRLNKVLGDAKPGSQQAELLKSIGLSAEELRKQDPAEALLKVAQALDQYADDSSKARLIQELFGKSVKEVAPFLADLAAKGKLVGTVTEEQAKQAEKFNQQLSALAKNAQDIGRSFLSALLPQLNKVAEDFRKAEFGVLDFVKALNKLGGFAIGGNLADRLGNVASSTELERLKNIAAGLENVKRSDEAAGRAENEANSRRLANLNARIAALQTEQALRQRLQSPFDPSAAVDAIRGGKPSAPGIPDTKTSSARDPRLSAEEIARLQASAEEDAAKDAAEAWDIYTRQQVDNAKERADAEKLMWKQVFEFIDSEQEREMEDAQKAFLESTQEMTEFAQQAARNIQDTLGAGLRQILGGNFKDIGQLFKNMLLDMVAQATAARIGKALFGDLLSGGSGNGSLFAGFLKFFGSANGNAFDTSGVVKFASGGVVSSATPFAFGGGRLGVMGEAGPEAVVPLKRGRDGKLGVSSSGGGVVINQTVNAGQGVTPAQLYATVTAANRALVERLQAAGKL